jgi:hypothetical protein
MNGGIVSAGAGRRPQLLSVLVYPWPHEYAVGHSRPVVVLGMAGMQTIFPRLVAGRTDHATLRGRCDHDHRLAALRRIITLLDRGVSRIHLQMEMTRNIVVGLATILPGAGVWDYVSGGQIVWRPKASTICMKGIAQLGPSECRVKQRQTEGLIYPGSQFVTA